MKVGFIGLGRMGQGMARRLLGGPHDLVVYDLFRAQAEALATDGARVATSIADACRERDAVVTMLADDATVTDVALAASGLGDSLPRGAIHIAMGTYGVATIRTLAAAHAERGQALVAAPVLGRPDIAAAGQLGIVAAGDPEAVGRCAPLFELMGRRTFQAGDKPEGASAIKLTNNALLACALAAMAEAFSLTRKYGVVPDVLYDVMTDGLFAAPAYKVYGKIMVDEAYDKVGFPTLLGLKDLNLALAAADQARVPMPSVNACRDRLLGAIAHGDGEKDWAVIAREQGRASGLD